VGNDQERESCHRDFRRGPNFALRPAGLRRARAARDNTDAMRATADAQAGAERIAGEPGTARWLGREPTKRGQTAARGSRTGVQRTTPKGLRSRLGATPAQSSTGRAPSVAKKRPSAGGSRRARSVNRAAVNPNARSKKGCRRPGGRPCRREQPTLRAADQCP
jgi:hypothetical protein